MSTFTQLLYHIVFSTKNRKSSLSDENRQEIYKYIWGILNEKKCHLYRINGTEDHIHILTHIHPTLSPASLVKDIKIASSIFIKKEGLFPMFQGWQEGYGAFTCSFKELNRLIEYVKKQEEHHKKRTFNDEYLDLLKEHGVDFNEKYLL